MTSPAPATQGALALETVFDLNGKPVVGALLNVYQAGTTTRATVYSDAALSVPMGQPISTTGSGRIPIFYVGTGLFRYHVTDATGAVVLDDIDGVEGAVVTTTTIVQPSSGSIPTGAMMAFYGTSAPDGWVRANGRTIGGPLSSATEFADAATAALYSQLWYADPNLAVSGGRGSSALADFNASKTIALPDLRRKAIVGLDGMGNSLLGGTATFQTIGSVSGEETHALSTGEMASHTHTATTDSQGYHTHVAGTDTTGAHTHGTTTQSAGTHNHYASAAQDGAHSHSASADTEGAHAHSYLKVTYSAAAATPTAGTTGMTTPETDTPTQTDTQGAHSHTITVANAGLHSHAITVANDGAHTHPISEPSAGAHTHVVTVQPDGAHTHNVSVSSAGSGTAHNNVQPSMPMLILLKL